MTGTLVTGASGSVHTLKIQNLGDSDVQLEVSGTTALMTIPAGTGQILQTTSLVPSGSSLTFRGSGNGTHLLFVMAIY